MTAADGETGFPASQVWSLALRGALHAAQVLWPHGHHAGQVVRMSARRGRSRGRRCSATWWIQRLSGLAADPSPVFPPPLQTHRELARPAHAQRRGHGAVHWPPETVSAPGPRGASGGGGRGAAWPPAEAGRGRCGAAVSLPAEWAPPAEDTRGPQRPALAPPRCA